MAKAPEPGLVKTRLIPPFSLEEAAEIYRCLLLDLLESVASFNEADLFVAFTPADSGAVFQELVPAGFVCFPQQGEDLGQRMNHVFGDVFNRGYGPVAIIGSDLPALPSGFLKQTFIALQTFEADVVLGPSRDGGYYLIGATRPISELFDEIAWGSSTVLSETVKKLSKLGLKPYFLPPWFDIDSVEDLAQLKVVLDQFAVRGDERQSASLSIFHVKHTGGSISEEQKCPNTLCLALGSIEHGGTSRREWQGVCL